MRTAAFRATLTDMLKISPIKERLVRIGELSQMTGLPVDYLRTRNDQINALTLDEVNRVARRLFDPEALHFVVVGQPEGLPTSE